MITKREMEYFETLSTETLAKMRADDLIKLRVYKDLISRLEFERDNVEERTVEFQKLVARRERQDAQVSNSSG